MRVVLFTLMALACCGSAAAAVYKWVDANGVTHFSDQPQPGAEKIHVAPPQTYQAPTTTPSAGSDTSSAAPSSSQPPSCTLSSPNNDEVFMNTSTVTGRFTPSSPLSPSDRVAVLIDGARHDVNNDMTGSFTVTNVDRGTHSLMVLVELANGQVRCQTPTVTVHVRQPSLQSPTSPVHPH